MAALIDEVWSEDADFHRVFSVLMEARVTARVLFDLFPDECAASPLYQRLEDALSEIWVELTRVERRTGWDAVG